VTVIHIRHSIRKGVKSAYHSDSPYIARSFRVGCAGHQPGLEETVSRMQLNVRIIRSGHVHVHTRARAIYLAPTAATAPAAAGGRFAHPVVGRTQASCSEFRLKTFLHLAPPHQRLTRRCVKPTVPVQQATTSSGGSTAPDGDSNTGSSQGAPSSPQQEVG
jgi:hypothetical protein